MTTTVTSRITATVQSYRQRLLQREAQAVQALERYHQRTLAVTLQRLNKLYDQILKEQKKLLASRAEDEIGPPKLPLHWIQERLRLEGIQLLISGQIDQFGVMALQHTRTLQHFGANLGKESAEKQVNTLVPPKLRAVINKYLPESKRIGATFGVPSTEAINNLIGATQAGSPLADLFNGFGQEAAQKVSEALVSGVTLGENPRTIAPRVQQALGMSRNRALVLVRNESLRCYKSAALETYRANDDVCGSWVWVADLSTSSCLACILLNGTEHPLSEEMQSHTCCRCSPSPKTRSFADILGDLGISSDGIEETSLNVQPGEEWFHSLSDEDQRAVFNSQSAYDLWKSGKVELQDFIGYDHDEDWGTSVKVKSVKELVGK